MKRIVTGPWLALSAVLLIGAAGCSSESGESGPTGGDTEDDGDTLAVAGIDVHQHFAANADFQAAATNLLASMDSIGIARSLLLPPPGSGDPDFAVHYDYTALQSIAASHADRLGFMGGGTILNAAIHRTVLNHTVPGEAALDSFEADARAIAAAGAAAFGEMAILHLSYTLSHPFIQIPADHPMFLRLADVAADVGLPIDVHLELCAEKRSLPPLFDAAPEGNNPDSLEENLAPFETLLHHNGEANIVWMHVGWDNIGDMTTGRLRTLLAAHPNLYMGIKMLDTPGPLQVPENRPLDASGAIRDDWYDLIVDYPDRFLLGADQFFGSGGGTIGSPSTAGTWSLLGELPDSVATLVARDNARAIYRLPETVTARPPANILETGGAVVSSY